MMTVRAAMLVLSALTWSALCGPALAWEVALMPDLVTRASVVRLADIAVVRDVDDAELKAGLEATIVAPGPTRSHARDLSSSDLRRMVEQRGLDMAQGRFTGATRVIITYGEPLTVTPVTSTRGHGIPNSRLRRDMERAGQVSATTAAADLPTDDARNLSTDQPMVVAVRELSKGQLIRKEDVTVLRVRDQELVTGTISCLEDVVGCQAAREIRTDEPLTTRALTKPLLVRSRDQVLVGVRCGGIVVTKHAIAQNDGGLGDTVVVSPMDDKKIRFSAQVVDVRKVVVMADSFGATEQPQ